MQEQNIFEHPTSQRMQCDLKSKLRGDNEIRGWITL